MKKIYEIRINRYRSNIEVYLVGHPDITRIYYLTTDSDSIPSASYIPTIRNIYESCDKIITLDQAR